jgi:hypothetical protein
MEPSHRFNLTGDPAIPCSTYAKFVVDTATSIGQMGDAVAAAQVKADGVGLYRTARCKPASAD